MHHTGALCSAQISLPLYVAKCWGPLPLAHHSGNWFASLAPLLHTTHVSSSSLTSQQSATETATFVIQCKHRHLFSCWLLVFAAHFSGLSKCPKGL